MSVNAFAKKIGRSGRAVTRAIETGKITAVVLVEGKPKISDPDLAAREFAERTRPRADAPGVAQAGDAYHRLRIEREEENLRAARAKREAEELALAARRGELVPVAEIEASLAEEYTAVRTKLLALPTRAKQRLSHLTAADVRVIDELVRDALGELADAGRDVSA